MALSDLFDLGLQGYDWYQRDQAINDAQDSINQGFDQGRADVQQYADPWVNNGLEHMGQYNNMGEFNFDYNNYLNSDNYQWMKDQGLQGVNRTAAAGHALGSGNTLDALVRNNQNYAQSQYGQEFGRQLEGYNTNKQYHQFPMEQGANAANMAGQYLSDMSIGQGGSLATLEMARAQGISNILGSAGGGEGAAGDSLGSTITDALGWVGDTLGITGQGAIDYVAEALGISASAVAGYIAEGGVAATSAASGLISGGGVGALTGPGTGLTAAGYGSQAADLAAQNSGIMGAGQQTATVLEENYAAAQASGLAGEASPLGFWGGLGTAAAGLAMLWGVKSVVEMLRGDPAVGKTMEKLSTSQNPIGDILGGMSMGGLFQHQATKNSWSKTTSDGALLNMVLGQADPEQLQALKYHKDADTVVHDMLKFATDGSRYNNDLGIDVGNTDTLQKLFPEMAADIKYIGDASMARLNAEDAMATWDGGSPGATGSYAMQRWENTYSDYSSKLSSVNSYINNQLDKWSTDALIAKAQAQAGVV